MAGIIGLVTLGRFLVVLVPKLRLEMQSVKLCLTEIGKQSFQDPGSQAELGNQNKLGSQNNPPRPLSNGLGTGFVTARKGAAFFCFSVRLMVGLIVGCGFLYGNVAQADQRYTVVDLGDSYFARDINNNGQIVGYYRTSNGVYHAFLYDHGLMRDIGNLTGYIYSDAYGINDKGQVVGYSGDVNWGRAFLYS